MPQLTVNEAGNSTFTDSITIKSGDFAAAVSEQKPMMQLTQLTTTSHRVQ